MKVEVTIDLANFDPLVMALQNIRAAIVEKIARELGLQVEMEFEKFFTYYFVEIPEDKYEIFYKLMLEISSKCGDPFRIYCDDEETRKKIQQDIKHNADCFFLCGSDHLYRS